LPSYTLVSPAQVEIEIRKSRFIGFVLPVVDRAEAMEQIERLRTAHPTATHVCWALLAGGQSGMSDDGEPSGTAGRPILEVLRHHELDSVLGAVVRYYGGVKLGAGGLVRAYADAIAGALKVAERMERVALAELSVEIGYPDEARVRRWIEQQAYALIHCSHGAAVNLAVRLPQEEMAKAEAALRDLTQGRVSIPAANPPASS
jgi:uncharacterized YigZ family protein